MKKTKTFTLSFILFVLFCNLLATFIIGWPGEGDCREKHGITVANISYDRAAIINLDGIPSEDFWKKEENQGAKIQIPLATNPNTPYFFVVYLNATFIQNDEFIYILCQWKDNTTKPNIGYLYDGIYFCWNIDCPNFSANFEYGMDTAEMGGGNVDSWDWDVNQATPPNGSSMDAGDFCFGEKGWYATNLETQDIQIAYTYVKDEYYTVEFKRKLVTDDEYDVQFNEKKQYLFNMGIMNDGRHEDHAISWTYALDFNVVSVNGYNVDLVLLTSLITIFPIVIIMKRKVKLK